MKQILNILKGALIGVANVIPGFSGGTMAVIIGVYDTLIDTIGNLLSHPIKALKNGWSLLVGIALGVLLALVAVVKLLETFPVPTICFFIGITIGTLPSTFTELKEYKKPKVKDITAFLIMAILILALQFLTPSTQAELSPSFTVYLVVFLLGILCAAAMVLPGVSGSLLLMLFGYYGFVLGSIKDFIKNFITLQFPSLIDTLPVILLFGVGAVIGLVGCAKLISALLKKFEKMTRYAIAGLLSISPVALVLSMVKNYSALFPTLGVLDIILAILCFAIGAFAIYWYGILSKKQK